MAPSAIGRQARTWLAPAVLVAAVVATLGQGRYVVAQSPGADEALRGCQRALWKKAFDEATAAGLNPGAMPVTFEARTATTTQRNGKLIATGTESYRPTPHTDAFDVRYECVTDLATGKVESLTYAAVDATGALSAKAPTTIVRERLIVGACRAKVYDRVMGVAVDQGLSAGGASAELKADDAVFAVRGATIDISGAGRIRLSADYEWQPVTFSCRYDPKKGEASRASYAPDPTVPAAARPALSADKARALDACQYAVEDDVLREAERSGYRALGRVRIELRPGATFTPAGADIEVKGRGEYKLDRRHPAPTPLTFTCRYHPARGQVTSASFEAGASTWTPSGSVATGTMRTLLCESATAVQRVCPAPIKGSVRIVRDRGRVPCEAYKNWIWSLSGITVWGGCRAEFEFEARQTP
jgi:hypothetical protein